jgi:GT2 family glycosyltransferase
LINLNNVGNSNAPFVAVVILNFNGVHFLQQFLPTVVATNYSNVQIYIADNASTDNSVQFVQQNYPQIKILINPTNQGYAQGYNTALAQIQANYFVLLNSDVAVTPNWLNQPIAFMQANKNIACCQPKILSHSNKNLFEYAGASGGFIDSFGYPFCRGRVFNHCEEDVGQYNSPISCFWATGAALIVRASVYQQLGGLDAYLFAHMEEIDFCWRAQLHGYQIYAIPDSVVYHVGGGTLTAANPKKTYLNFRNSLIVLFKNSPLTTLFWLLPCRFLLDAVFAYKELFSGNFANWLAVAKAHFGFIYWLLFAKKSKKATPKNTPLQGVYKGSIVFKFYVRGKNKFSEIIGN